MHITHAEAEEAHADKREDHGALEKQSPARQPTTKDLARLASIHPKRL